MFCEFLCFPQIHLFSQSYIPFHIMYFWFTQRLISPLHRTEFLVTPVPHGFVFWHNVPFANSTLIASRSRSKWMILRRKGISFILRCLFLLNGCVCIFQLWFQPHASIPKCDNTIFTVLIIITSMTLLNRVQGLFSLQRAAFAFGLISCADSLVVRFHLPAIQGYTQLVSTSNVLLLLATLYNIYKPNFVNTYMCLKLGFSFVL